MAPNNQNSAQNSNPNDRGEHSAPSIPRASQASANADLAQALRDLARGEQAASALEANLATLEVKLDELLAAFEGKQATSSGQPKEPGLDQTGQSKKTDGEQAKLKKEP